ncbi:MAG: rRNA pseudouridine synthase [Streptococcaceae bacterium]|nr:rRNA pseudouridine synthase [Streptococcaceae bacterium]MCH4177371.1 rRNA pseudouridine synthase [Streptococcaceae bacterium]
MERINKYIAHAGVASRRKADELIKTGKVTVNGERMTDLSYQVSKKDIVEVEGVRLYQEEPVYFVFNKPRGVISSVSDEKGRQTVLDFFPAVKERIYPVGRLDWDTSGLLILTNDGQFANLLTHPKHEIDKVYVAKVKGIANRENLKPFVHGMRIDGFKISPAQYQILKVDPVKQTSIVELTIHEGKNHQVKKMFERCQLPVQKLSRIRIGNLDLTGVPAGQYRPLSKKEVSQLWTLATK